MKRILFPTFWLVLFGLVLVVRSQELTIVTEDFPPYNYNEGGKAKGLSVEVVQAVMEEVGISSDIQIYSWARAYKMAHGGKNVLIFNLVRSREREKMFKWVGVIAPYKTSLYKLRSRKDIVISSLEDARKYEVGATRNDIKAAFLEKNRFPHIQYVGNDRQNILKLVNGRIDIMPYDEASLVYRLKREGTSSTKFEKILVIDELCGVLYMAFGNRSDDELVEKVRRGLQIIKENGVYDRIINKYRL